MWHATLCSGLAALSCGWAKHLKTQRFLARWMWLLTNCVFKFVWWAWMFSSVLERQITILEDRYHHHIFVWQRYCRKLTFWACIGLPVFMLVGMCILGSILGAMTRSGHNCLAWRWAGKSITSFARDELSFLKLGSVLVDLTGEVLNSFLRVKFLFLRSKACFGL